MSSVAESRRRKLLSEIERLAEVDCRKPTAPADDRAVIARRADPNMVRT